MRSQKKKYTEGGFRLQCLTSSRKRKGLRHLKRRVCRDAGLGVLDV